MCLVNFSGSVNLFYCATTSKEINVRGQFFKNINQVLGENCFFKKFHHRFLEQKKNMILELFRREFNVVS
jgi:hypothetical protein